MGIEAELYDFAIGQPALYGAWPRSCSPWRAGWLANAHVPQAVSADDRRRQPTAPACSWSSSTRARRCATRCATPAGGRSTPTATWRCCRCIEPVEFQHWLGVGRVLESEARAEAELRLQSLAAEVFAQTGSMPVLHIREGNRAEQLVALLQEDPVDLAPGAGDGERRRQSRARW